MCNICSLWQNDVHQHAAAISHSAWASPTQRMECAQEICSKATVAETVMPHHSLLLYIILIQSWEEHR